MNNAFREKNGRSGVTLVELLLFIGIIAIVGAALIPLLFSSTEARLLQESMSLVETNGSQTMQVLTKKIRESNRIISPLPGQTGSVLTLQMPIADGSPAIFGLLTGSLLMVQHETSQTISASEVSVENFWVRNTGNGTSTGVYVSFLISRTIRLRAPRMYRQTFQTFVDLYPKNVIRNCPCEFGPTCTLNGTYYTWNLGDQACNCLLTSSRQLNCK